MALITKSGEIVRRLPHVVFYFPNLIRPLAEVERNAIESAMILCEGDVQVAAAHLGISRTTVRAKIALYRSQDQIALARAASA